eukprot:TRINITY_DN870_c0_g1_i2.p1 TRINITY_DN870_c0_g1~~TRINITY_DN870_c0_g1_i2.p1  ORF type:complete len:354 (-),score=77.75 TRINITY_DN870_c0_g1_i2:182-1243(-)
MIRRPPRSTHCISSAASDVYKRQIQMKILILSLIILWAVSARYTEGEASQMFQLWKQQNFKSYGGEWEESFRFIMFQNNLVTIDRLNNEQSDAQFAPNKFADLSPEEFAALYLTQIDIETIPKHYSTKKNMVFSPAPDSFDWTTQGVVNAAKDQGQCNSQFAFTAVASLESEWAITNKVLYDLAEQQLVDCDTKDSGCNGGLFQNAFTYIADAGGVMLTTDYQYTGQQGTCQFDKTKVAVQIESYQDLEADNEVAMVDYLYNIGPLGAMMHADELQFYSGGIFNPLACPSKGKKELDHSVNPVGYGTENSKKFWKCKNSWGSDWGENGFFRLIRGENKCGIADTVSSVFVPKI